MAEQIITDPITGAQAPLNVGTQTPGVNPGTDGAGKHIDNAPLSVGLTEEAVPDLLHTPFDKDVTVMGYPDTVINQITREMGYRQIKAMKFDSFSIDQRRSADTVTSKVDITAAQVGGSKVFSKTAIQTIPVANEDTFHLTDQVIFKNVPGYDRNGLPHKFYFLSAYVCDIDRKAHTVDVVLTNANPAQSLNVTTITIPANTEIIILGHALAEEDSHVAPNQSIPEPAEHFMQKFMVQASVTNVFLDSEKNVNWGLADIKETLTREFLLEIEKTYLWGHKGYFLDPNTNKYIRTLGGLFEQLLEEGIAPIEIWKGDLTDESIITTMSDVFVGNRGSERRFMLTGMDFASALFSLKSMQKQVSTNATRRQFTYDWQEWKLFNYTISNKPYALFDMLGFGNVAFVFDKANIERGVFRALDEEMLDLDKLMIEDSKVLRCCEISSIVLKYAKCHRLIIMHDGTQTDNPDGSKDKVRLAA